MRITNQTFIAFFLNSAIDTGKYDGITVDEVRRHIEAGSIFEFLQEKLGRDIDLSIYDEGKRAELLEFWQGMVNAIDAKRKFGVQRNGLCLLVAYLLEMIQQTQDKNPPR